VLRGLVHSAHIVQNIIIEVLNPGSELATAVASLLVEHGFSLKSLTGTPWHIGNPCIEGNILAQRDH
jgi:hypothetical protein